MNTKRIILSCTLLIPFMFSSTVDAGLVAAYSFNGDDATDDSGGNNHGVLGAATAFSSDVPPALGGGRSVVFTGDKDNSPILVPNSPALAAVDSNMTIAFWIKGPLQQGNMRLLQKRLTVGPHNPGWSVVTPGSPLEDNIQVRVDTQKEFGQNISSARIPTPFDDTWHHIAFTFEDLTATALNDGELRAYLDGGLVGTGVYSFPSPAGAGFANNEQMYIGGGPGRSATVLMDDFGIWDEVLDANAIAALAAGPIIIPEPSTLVLLVMGIMGCGLHRFSRRRKRA